VILTLVVQVTISSNYQNILVARLLKSYK